MIINPKNINLPEISSLEDQYLYDQVARCIYGYNKLLLSYSGGLDSTVLLDILTILIEYYNSKKQLDHPILLRAIYVHHGLSNQSGIWADHCAQQCKIRNIPFGIIDITCDQMQKTRHNIEALARELRYRKLCNCLNSEEILLTAHHMDDQVETVLLALKRGSGPAGLSGITRNIIYHHKYRLLRPLLRCSRKQLEVYAYRKKLSWVEDHTNTDIRFDRNFLRIQIIPLLKKRWPNFHKVVSRTAYLCRNQEKLLHELLSESLNQLISLTDDSLFFYPLLQYNLSKRQILLRYWLKKFFINMPSYKLLYRIWEEVALSRIDANPILHLGNKYVCRRFHNRLYILPIDVALPINIYPPLHWNKSNNTICLPKQLGSLISHPILLSELNNNFFRKTTANSSLNFNVPLNIISNSTTNNLKKVLTHCCVRAPKSDEKISIRFGYIQELLYPSTRKHGRKLKKIWQEFNIPPWLRGRIPLLFYNDILITAIGVFITKPGKIIITNETKNKNYTIWNIYWIQKNSYYRIFKGFISDYLQ